MSQSDLMNELDDLLAEVDGPSAGMGQVVPGPPVPVQVVQPPPQGAKDVLGQKLRNQMSMSNNSNGVGHHGHGVVGGVAEKRKLEEGSGGPPELLSKTQKMDNGPGGGGHPGEADFNAVVNGVDHQHVNVVGSQSRLLEQALMEKRPQNQQASMMGGGGGGLGGPGGGGIRPPPMSFDNFFKKFQHLQQTPNNRDEIGTLMTEYPQHKARLQQMLKNKNNSNMNTMQQTNMMPGGGGPPDGSGGMMVGGPQDQNNFYNQRPTMPMQRPPMGSPMGQHSWPPSGPQPNMGYNGGTMVQPGPPQKMLRPPQGGGGIGGRPYFNDSGPPPNTWVGGPNVDPKIMMGGGPPGPGGPGGPQNPAYYRNNMCQQRPPMMRPPVGIPNHYGGGDFAPNGTPTNAGGQPMYGQIRTNNYMTTNGSAGDPYGNSRFASPASVAAAATNGVCPPAMYSPNAAPDSMMVSRMNGGNFNDVNPAAAAANNGSYNNFNDFNGYTTNRVRPNFMNPNAGGGQQPQQQPQMMPTFNGGAGGRGGGPLNQSSPMYHGNNIQQQPGFNTNYNVNNMDQLQQQHQQQQHHHQQQQQQQVHQTNPNSMMSNGGGPPGPGSSDFDYPSSNGISMMENNNEVMMEWKLKSNDIRQTLLAKLKEALMGQEYPNAEAMANQFEQRAFNESNSINDYQMKLARSLASIFENSNSSSSITNSTNQQQPLSNQQISTINSPPDSSTNDQISDVTTSSSSGIISGNNDNVITGNGNNGGSGNSTNDSKNSALEDLLNGQPPSASPSTATALASPIGGGGSTSTSMAAVSPVSSAASSIAITSGSAPSTLTTTATSSSLPTTGTSTTSTSNTTFQHPAMPPVNSSNQHSTDSSLAASASATNSNDKSSLNGGTTLPAVVVPPNIVAASNRVGGPPQQQSGPPGSSQPPLPPQQQQRRISGSGALSTAASVTTSLPVSSISNNPQSVDSGIGLGSPRSITSASSTTLYSPKIQGTSPSLIPGSDNSPEKASSS